MASSHHEAIVSTSCVAVKQKMFTLYKDTETHVYICTCMYTCTHIYTYIYICMVYMRSTTYKADLVQQKLVRDADEQMITGTSTPIYTRGGHFEKSGVMSLQLQMEHSINSVPSPTSLSVIGWNVVWGCLWPPSLSP